MEELWKILGVTKGVTAVIGSGGKTSLLYELAEELRPCGTVLLATTTHIMRPPQYPFVQTPEELAAALAAGGVACVGSLTPVGKLTAPAFDGWQQTADFVLVEADGSKRLPAKAHETWEPVLPPERIDALLRELAEQYDWTIDHMDRDFFVAHTHPAWWSATWGEQIFVAHDRGGIWINSINDLGKRSSIVSFGYTRRNIRRVTEAIAAR